MSRRTGDRRAALLLLLVPALASAAGGATIEARVDRNEIALGETLQLEITLRGSEEPSLLDLPTARLRDFEVVSQAQSISISLGGAQSGHSRTYRFSLRPEHTGTLTIPSATCVVAGKRHSTAPIHVQVRPASGAPRSRPPTASPQIPFPQMPFPGMPSPPMPGADDDDGFSQPPDNRDWERGLTLRVVTDKRQAWLGEQVTASITLYSPVDLEQVSGFRPPSLDGFWSEDLTDPSGRVTGRIEEIRGVRYHVFLIKKMALFPTRAGRLTIGTVQLEVSASTGFGFFHSARKLTRKSEPVAIDVRPLPRDSAPVRFQSVNVGQWGLEASVSEGRVAAGQPVTYRLQARGHGSLHALALPALPPQPGMKLFDPTVKDEVELQGDRFGGTKTVESVLVPERTGTLVLPALEWQIFDPAAGAYQLLHTDPVRVEVTPGAPGTGTVDGATANTLSVGLKPIRTEGRLSRAGPPPWKSPFFVLLLAVPVLLFAGMAISERVREWLRSGGNERRVRRAGRRARRRFAAARKLLSAGDAPAFHAEVTRALLGYASDKLGRTVQGLTRDALAAELGRAGAHPPAVTALAAALDASDAGRFGMGEESRAQTLRAAEQAMEMLEEADWREPREVA